MVRTLLICLYPLFPTILLFSSCNDFRISSGGKIADKFLTEEEMNVSIVHTAHSKSLAAVDRRD